MLKRQVAESILLLLLVSSLALSFNTQPVRAIGTIYIRADGSIDPPTAPISTIDNIIYTITGDIYDSVVVERDNIVIDGAGYTIQGLGTGTGIDLSGRNNVAVKNTNIKNSIRGINLWDSDNNAIYGNNVTNNDDGIWLLGGSSYNTIFENNVKDNRNVGIGLFHHSTSYNIIYGNNISANYNIGIWLEYSSYNQIYGNNITNSYFGVYLYACSSNLLHHNNFVNNVGQASNTESSNIWDDGYPSGGNYWSDYTGNDIYSGPYQNETYGDGIGDTPYVIDGANRDLYPLMNPVFWLPQPWYLHDVVVTNVIVPKTVVCQGYGLNMSITTANHGIYTETFDVTVYANETIIATLNDTTLTNGTFATTTFTWNTSGCAKGNYTIVAVAETVPGEIFTADNTYVDSLVAVAMVGDINADGKVDVKDVFKVAKAYGSYGPDFLYPSSPPHPNWNAVCDINNDKKVDVKDYYIVCKHYGEVDP